MHSARPAKRACRSASYQLDRKLLRRLHDPDLAEAILDRILERGRIVTLEGPSMRTRHLDPLPGQSDQETAS